MLNKVAFSFRTRDAGLATLISLAGITLLGIALAFHHWTGVAAGAGLILLGIETHVLQGIGEKSSEKLEQSTTKDVLERRERELSALNLFLQESLSEQLEVNKRTLQALEEIREELLRLRSD